MGGDRVWDVAFGSDRPRWRFFDGLSRVSGGTPLPLGTRRGDRRVSLAQGTARGIVSSGPPVRSGATNAMTKSESSSTTLPVASLIGSKPRDGVHSQYPSVY